MWLFNTTLTHFLIGYLYSGGEPVNDFTVDTTYGTVRGTKSAVSRNGRNYYEFQGIPYAQPPLGNLRFESPVPPHTWTGILNTTSPGNRCLQIRLITNNKLGDEDCLNLNVFTHQIQSRRDMKPLERLNPVIYFIHGGFFMGGAADIFGSKYYMDEDVVLVTANYRVAALGFLNTGDGVVRGNMGLKDQNMVLRWIQENIQYFGGDPNKVTIIGESAGGVSSHYHMLSPMSRGLFRGCVSQSGTALVPWALNSNPAEQAKQYADSLNCTRNSTKEMVACLKSLDAKTVVEAHRDIRYHLENRMLLFRPTVEVINDEWTFLNDTPINIIKNNGSAKVPWIGGVNSGEGLIFAAAVVKNETRRDQLNSDWNKWAPVIFNFENEIEKDEISRRIRKYYFGDKDITENSWQNFTNLLSDYQFFNGIHDMANLGKDGVLDTPMYLYYFSYEAQFSLGKLAYGMTGSLPIVADVVVSTGYRWISTNLLGMEEKHFGAAHADEMFLIFEMPLQTEHKVGTKDYEMSKNLVTLLTSFARDGKPEDIKFPWSPVEQKRIDPIFGTLSNGTIKYLQLDRKLELIDEPFQDRVQFWKSLNILNKL